jgi:hypothetical protein
MPHYRVNYLDPHGRVTARFEFQCPSDRDAELACQDLPEPLARELWCGPRWIRAWPAPVAHLPGA